MCIGYHGAAGGEGGGGIQRISHHSCKITVTSKVMRSHRGASVVQGKPGYLPYCRLSEGLILILGLILVTNQKIIFRSQITLQTQFFFSNNICRPGIENAAYTHTHACTRTHTSAHTHTYTHRAKLDLFWSMPGISDLKSNIRTTRS